MTVDLHHCTRLLRSCDSYRCISRGRQLHQLLLKSGHSPSLFPSNCLLQMYARCSLPDARLLFDEMPQRNCFSWNSLLDSYLKSGDPTNALHLFDAMPHKNTFSWNSVVTALVRYGDLETSRHLLEQMPVKDAIACNAVIHGYLRSGRIDEAFRLFKKIDSGTEGRLSPCTDSFVLATVVSACADQLAYDRGKQVHARIVVGQVLLDSVLGSALVDVYAKCGDLDCAWLVFNNLSEADDFSISALISGYAGCGRLTEARQVFDRREGPSVVLWNSMINGYASNNEEEEALKLFIKMRRSGAMPDSSTCASVLNACSFLSLLEHGRQMHVCGLKHGVIGDIIVASALIDCYSKSSRREDACKVFSELKDHDTVVLNSMINVHSNSGNIEEARRLFEMIPNKSLISWNSMIVGFSQNGCAIEALRLFHAMHRLGLWIDKVAIASALSACASICCIAFGEQIFALSITLNLEPDHVITSSLIDLYSKCGNVVNARRLFDGMKTFDEITWNSMLMGYASNGRGKEALEMFEAMRSLGLRPSKVTFIGVLSCCCHCGYVEEGLRWFHGMMEEHQIEPSLDHYVLICDLLARAGRLEEAVDLINEMPFEADASMWTSVLGGCKAHGNDTLAKMAAERLIEIDHRQSGSYVQLSSFLAARGEWERSARVRRMMRDRELVKNPGVSWIDM